MQKKLPLFLAALSSATILGAATLAHASAFTAGDLVVLQTAGTTADATASLVELDPTQSNSSALQTIAINASNSSTALRFDGSATDTGYLSHSADGSLLTFTGAHTTSSGLTLKNFATRGVGAVDPSGTFGLVTTYTGSVGYETCSATTLDGSVCYIGDERGLYSNDASVPTVYSSLRSVKPFGGVVYTLQVSGTASAIYSISSPTASSLDSVQTGGAYTRDFYMVSSGQNGSAYDLLYVTNASSGSAGYLSKYALINGQWTSEGSASLTFGAFGIAAKKDGNSVDLYLTSGANISSSNRVVELTDSASYDAHISTGAMQTLYFAPSGQILRGIDFAPTAAVPEPASMGLLAAGALALLRRRRK